MMNVGIIKSEAVVTALLLNVIIRWYPFALHSSLNSEHYLTHYWLTKPIVQSYSECKATAVHLSFYHKAACPFPLTASGSHAASQLASEGGSAHIEIILFLTWCPVLWLSCVWLQHGSLAGGRFPQPGQAGDCLSVWQHGGHSWWQCC